MDKQSKPVQTFFQCLITVFYEAGSTINEFQTVLARKQGQTKNRRFYLLWLFSAFDF